MNYIEVDKCRCCNNKVEKILDLNYQPLSNSFHKIDEKLEFFPLKLNLCRNCYHAQLSVVVDPNLIFKDYLYVSGTSNTLKEYFDFFSRFTIERFKNYFNCNPINVLDIACNDGTQLNYYKSKGISTYGIDPAQNLHHESSKNHNVICDFFPSNKLQNKYNIIVAQNVFAHTHNIENFLKKCSEILEDNGILFIQTSQANMILRNEFDTIYHEHLSFFNSLSMKTIVEKSNLILNNVFKFDIHGTSYIFEISKTKFESNLNSVIDFEKEKGLYDYHTYVNFSKNAEKIIFDLKNIISDYKKMNYLIVGIGAAAKGMTLINYGNLMIDVIIDENKMKHDLYTPGMDIPIKSINVLKTFDSEKILFIPLAWNFFDEIYKKIKNIRNDKNDFFVKYFPNCHIIK